MIYLKDYVQKERILFLDDKDKQSAIKTLIQKAVESPNIQDHETFEKAIFEREFIVSTGIGLGIAIPHVKIDSVKDMTVTIGISKDGIDWEAIDNEPVHIVLLIAGSKEQHQLYLRLLSKFILVLKKEQRRTDIMQSKTVDDILKIFSDL